MVIAVSINDILAAWDAVRGLGADPAVSCVMAGLVWPLVQAALDKPWWTPTRRRALVVGAAVILSLVIWVVSSYPWAWEIIATQTSIICGIAWIMYGALASVRVRGVRLVDWAGIITPGGETRADYTARHLAPSPEVDAPAGDTGAPETLSWKPLSGGEAGGVGD